MTVDTSFGSQSSRLKMLHFLHVHEFLLEDEAELAPDVPALFPPPFPLPPNSFGAKFKAEEAFLLRAEAGRMRE